ncbi:protein kinase, putative [Talaromyces stipitatus ATCC 10500]|uniref:non-specific serine/threonine protein kinase n=1 Tax=Talaromyces stipitatus (strain ATCC 10500 / CBS 375.48 / QM 6759 / NRRL 1006) TaxID=441959 RepID=B8ME59_TALSN|nr:protein kinase, putative [Talaromyces stipitatus ATCC 10500]EED16486.1 protein kinase, putative [Talaromyces stipitatus ATCC 10500]
MADDAPMSIVPYSSNRHIVLRHNDSVVVLDRDSQQLVLRNANNPNNGDLDLDIQDCPYCHRPMRDRDNEAEVHRGRSGGPAQHDFVTPEYFRLLHDSVPNSEASTPPLSPRLRLAQPALTDGSVRSSSPYAPPSPSSPQGISSAAFSQGYFKKFFVEEAELGRGGKGVVLLVKHMLDGVSLGHFACKRVPVGDDHEWLEKVLVEVQLLQHLSHQNLVSYRHVWLEDFKISTFSPSVPCAFILQQYCNAGDLHKYVVGSVPTSTTAQQLKERLRRRSKGQPEAPDFSGPRKLQFEEIYSFFRDITSGIRFLHANGFIHRDLKPSNCLLHDSGQELRVLVSDFGEVQPENTVRKSTGTTGTISYCAPEVLQREYPNGPFVNFTFKSDVFSLGMILHFLCFAQLPYHSADLIEEKEDIDELRAEISTWKGFDDSLKRLRPDLPDKLYTILERLLSINPSRRPTADEVLLIIQAGVTGNESRRFGRASSNGPDFSQRIQPVESPVPNSPQPSRSPVKVASRSTGPLAVRSPVRYETRSVTSNRNNTILETDSDSQYRHRSPSNPDQDVILRPRFRSTPSTPPRRIDDNDEVQQTDGQRRYTHPMIDHRNHDPPSTPPDHTLLPPHRLLPPPPETLWSSNSYLYFIPIPSMDLQVPIPNVRVTLFIAKQILISQTCMPMAVNPWVYYPLFILAVLSLPVQSSKTQLISLAVHLGLMALSVRMDSICVWGSSRAFFA